MDAGCNYRATPYLVGFLQDVHEFIDLSAVGLCEECVGGSLVVRSSGSADSVHVVLDVGWEVVVDDELHVVDI